MFYTTLNKIRACSLCQPGWEKLLAHLGKTKADDEPLPFSVILKSNGLDDALWCGRAAPEYAREGRLYAVWCARQVQHLMTDPRSTEALDIAERYANGLATEEELAAARDAAAAAAGDNAWDAAAAAAGDAAAAAAEDAAGDAAAAAAVAGDTAWAAVGDAAGDAAWAAAKDAQAEEFKRIIGEDQAIKTK